MGDIPADFEQKRVTVFEGTFDELCALAVLGHYFGVAPVRRQIDGEGDQLFADDGLRAVDYQLKAEGDALCVGEGSFELVFLRQVVQDLEDQGAEARRF